MENTVNVETDSMIGTTRVIWATCGPIRAFVTMSNEGEEFPVSALILNKASEVSASLGRTFKSVSAAQSAYQKCEMKAILALLEA